MLNIKDKAPDFTLLNQREEKISLSSFKGKKVVIYFYPKDNTPGCTTQACNLRDNLNTLQKHNIEVLGISTDSAQSHKKFADKFSLSFHLLADDNKEVVNLYDVWKEKNMYGKKYMGTKRTTFLIDEQGLIDGIIKMPKTKEHTSEILKHWKLT